jgi:hypothetical protein
MEQPEAIIFRFYRIANYEYNQRIFKTVMSEPVGVLTEGHARPRRAGIKWLAAGS